MRHLYTIGPVTVFVWATKTGGRRLSRHSALNLVTGLVQAGRLESPARLPKSGETLNLTTRTGLRKENGSFFLVEVKNNG